MPMKQHSPIFAPKSAKLGVNSGTSGMADVYTRQRERLEEESASWRARKVQARRFASGGGR